MNFSVTSTEVKTNGAFDESSAVVRLKPAGNCVTIEMCKFDAILIALQRGCVVEFEYTWVGPNETTLHRVDPKRILDAVKTVTRLSP